ncbi:hypothetical protein Syun_014924 [Stephania yunnanensis]|uniref:Uncharacterized protein n=1 Tax=Stephania yunnanensis TaxID=152371 RepID=A0AAP0PA27_9MAGN
MGGDLLKGDKLTTKDPKWTWTRGIDYERVVRFVKPKGKTLEYLFCFVFTFI